MNVYQWALPEDLGPLRNAVESIIGGNVQVLLVASSVQIRHLYEVAESMAKRQALQEALARVVITSVGPIGDVEVFHGEDVRSGAHASTARWMPSAVRLTPMTSEATASVLNSTGHQIPPLIRP